jgi:hypothetical protein
MNRLGQLLKKLRLFFIGHYRFLPRVSARKFGKNCNVAFAEGALKKLSLTTSKKPRLHH